MGFRHSFALAVCTLPGCASSPGDAAPALAIVRPADGATVCGRSLKVVISVENFELVPLETPTGPRQGHVDLFLNGQSAAMTDTLETDIQDVADGAWQLRADLVNGDHTAITPYVGDFVYFTVDNTACDVREDLTVHDANTVFLGEEGSWSGATLAVADIDGNGGDELIYGGPARSQFCWLETESSPLTPHCVTDPESSSWSGSALADGDLDGDGVTDLAVGARNATPNDVSGAGSVQVYSGPLAENSLPTATVFGVGDLDGAGWSIAIGDLDDDGLDDLVVGAPGADTGGRGGGEVWVFDGPLPTVPLTPADARTFFQGQGAELRHAGVDEGGDGLGAAVAVADWDDDGVDDLAISAGGDDTVAPNAGLVLLFKGPLRAGRLGFAAANAVLRGTLAESFFGEPIVSAGDIDGDGRTDLFVGANATSPAAGYLFTSPFEGGTTDDATTVFTGGGNDGLSWSYAGGDFDGDGSLDAAIGAPYAANGGQAYVLFGPLPGGMVDVRRAGVAILADTPHGALGWSVAASNGLWLAAPFNADGRGMITHYAW